MRLKKCPKCKDYFLEEKCPKCQIQTKEAHYKYLRIKDAPKSKLKYFKK